MCLNILQAVILQDINNNFSARRVYDYARGDYFCLVKELQAVNWNPLLDSKDVDYCVQFYTDAMKGAMERHIEDLLGVVVFQLGFLLN